MMTKPIEEIKCGNFPNLNTEKFGKTISAPDLIKDMQSYCNEGVAKDIILKRLTDNYNLLSGESNATHIALLCSKIAIDNYLLANLVSTISIQK